MAWTHTLSPRDPINTTAFVLPVRTIPACAGLDVFKQVVHILTDFEGRLNVSTKIYRPSPCVVLKHQFVTSGKRLKDKLLLLCFTTPHRITDTRSNGY